MSAIESDDNYDATTDEDAVNPGEDDNASDASISVTCSEEDIAVKHIYGDAKGKIAFCCQNCVCDKSLELMQIRNNCGNSSGDGGGNTQLYHKACCHNDREHSEDYLSPMMRAIHATLEGNMKKKAKLSLPAKSDLLGKSEILKQYNRAKKEEAQYENEECDVDKTSQILTNQSYTESIAIFQKRQKRRNGLRVLDLFSGIGSGTVVLKKLRLPIHSIVHIEHDPIAVEVVKWNHQDDGILHHYIEHFEEIYGTDSEPNDKKISALIGEYGPFDLVTSGAPCQNLSGINAYRNIDAENAQYLMKAGKLIKKLDHVQASNGFTEKILFLSENVVFKEFEKFDVHYSDSLEGLSPICQDAKDFGPVKRKRLYWLNLPVKTSDYIKEFASAVSAGECLDDGFTCISSLLREMSTSFKANAFLASQSRVDDSRMFARYKVDTNGIASRKYNVESYSVSERERMMGLPVGYVEEPLKHIYKQLTENAFAKPEMFLGKTYRDFLPRSLWHFRNKCKFKFEPSTNEPFFHILLSSPLEGKKDLVYFNEEQYCKHLIGNGWSIPVVEHLLSRLPDLFEPNSLVTYEAFNYNFPWAPYNT